MEPISYVENDENDVFLLRRALTKIGFRDVVRHFRNGDSFKRELLSVPEPPRLFLFDLKLDAESGLDLLRWVKQQTLFAHLPAIIFSSGSIPDEMIESMALDASAYMFKPMGVESWREVAEHLALLAGLSPSGQQKAELPRSGNSASLV